MCGIFSVVTSIGVIPDKIIHLIVTYTRPIQKIVNFYWLKWATKNVRSKN